MFFGVNITPVRHRLGINIRSNNTEESDTLDKRNGPRSKYGVPFTSRWKVEVQNLSRDISWQDLKDFCFNKTRVRPSHADVSTDRRGIGTLCCATEGEMRVVLQKLNGAHFKGKSLRAIDHSVSKDSTKSRDESRGENRRRSDRPQNDRPQNDRPQNDRPQSDRPQSDRPQSGRPQSGRPQSGRPQSGRPQSDRPRIEPPRIEPPRIERPRIERPRIERPRIERPRTERPRIEPPRIEPPRIEPPRIERPRIERPRMERPRMERPRIERPRIERPRIERPRIERPRIERPRIERHQSEHSKSEHSKSDRHTDNHPRSERNKDGHAPVSIRRNHDESKVIIHQPTGDRVITEIIDNHAAYDAGDDGHHSENEQTYFKRDRKNRSGGQGGGRRGGGDENGLTEVRLSKRTRAIYKYGMPYKTKWKLRVENLSSEVSWQDLKDLIRPYADVRYADAHKPIQGIGNVCVSTPEGLHNIINKLNNSDIKGMVARFIDESELEDDDGSVESTEPDEHARSRSPHKSRRSRSVGNDSNKRSKSK